MGDNYIEFVAELKRLLQSAAANVSSIANTGPGAVATQRGVAAGNKGWAVGRDVNIGRQINTGGGSFAGRDLKIISNRYAGRPPKSNLQKRRVYLDVLADLVGHLPMRAFDECQANAYAAPRERGVLGRRV
jgi:hypothetical protein